MAIVTITVENDSDFYRTFQYITVNADGSLGPAIDITGASLAMMLRRRAEDATALIRFGTDTGEFELIDPVNGKFTLLIPQLTLEQLGLGSFDHSNIMTLNGVKTEIWSGQMIINAGPTR